MLEEVLNWIKIRLFWLVKPFYRHFCLKKLPLHYTEHWKQPSDRASLIVFCFILFYEQINYLKPRYNCLKIGLHEAWASYKVVLRSSWKLQYQLLSFETSKKCFLRLWLHIEHRYIFLFYWRSKAFRCYFWPSLSFSFALINPSLVKTKQWIALRKLLKQKVSYKNPFSLIFNWIWSLTDQFSIFVSISKLLKHSSNRASWYFCFWELLELHLKLQVQFRFLSKPIWVSKMHWPSSEFDFVTLATIAYMLYYALST